MGEPINSATKILETSLSFRVLGKQVESMDRLGRLFNLKHPRPPNILLKPNYPHRRASFLQTGRRTSAATQQIRPRGTAFPWAEGHLNCNAAIHPQLRSPEVRTSQGAGYVSNGDIQSRRSIIFLSRRSAAYLGPAMDEGRKCEGLRCILGTPSELLSAEREKNSAADL